MTRESSAAIRALIKKVPVHKMAGRGSCGLSAKHLAGGVGITEEEIFRHFKSMRDILKAIMEHILNGLRMQKLPQ